ncbi:chitobiase/beta-hexosaminidase C-terminal domain-containing protein [Beggiatoa alba]|nr:chitobiase/beta-hexosaminidase C-terminal domain-containing protein [Beggiatoa alba]
MLVLPSAGNAETYAYDTAGRLTSATYDDGSSITYTYDSSGNILQQQVATLDATAPTTTAAPTGGAYNSAQSVTLNCDDGTGSGCATTYYTLDSTEPTTSSSVYSTAISISTNTTLKFFSADNVGNSEAIKTESYVIQISTSNNPPAAFNLVSPADSATTQATALTLIWKKSVDPDGDRLSYQVIYCDNASFTGCSSVAVAFLTNNTVVVASVGSSLTGLFVLGMLFAGSNQRTRLKKQLALIMLIAIFAGMSSCGGGGGSNGDGNEGGGGDDPITPAADEVGYSVTGLQSATTYYWKITANDGNGGMTESTVWSFTTQ